MTTRTLDRMTDAEASRPRCGAVHDNMQRCTRRDGHDGDHTPPASPTAVRHLRFPVDAWKRAATRAKSEGHGVAAVAVALVTAYADGRIDHPDHATSSTGTATLSTQPDTDGIVRRPGRAPNGTGKQPNRSFRISDEKWNAGVAAAHTLGVTLASRLVQAVDDVIAEASSRR